MSLMPTLRKQKSILRAEDYVNARLNYEEAIYNTDDQEQRIKLYKKYQLTYLVPVYADQTRQHSSSDELFVNVRLLRREKRFLEAAEIYDQLANSNLSAEDTVYTLYWAGRCYHKVAPTHPNLFNKSVSAFKKLVGNYSNGEYTIEAYYYLTLVYCGLGRNIWQHIHMSVSYRHGRESQHNLYRQR